MIDYDRIHEMKGELSRSALSLIALSENNDPFYVTPRRKRDAEWIAQPWDDLPGRAHCRRIHYFLLSRKEPVKLPDGSPYHNSLDCWRGLCLAVRDAIYLGLVPAEAITDQRSEAPHIYFFDGDDGGIWVTGTSAGGGFSGMPSLPSIYFDPPKVSPAYQVEIWIEKSTMNDVLLPLAARYGVNVMVNAGEASATMCRALVSRAIRSGKLVRIIYISDFDPGGLSMPLAVARKIEFELYRCDRGDLDIQLQPIALTHEQCVEYELPRIPSKDEGRKERFEARFGGGCTELDALEAFRPGVLAELVEREIERYQDPDQDERLEDAERQVRHEIAEVEQTVYARHADAVAALREEWKALEKQWRALREKTQPLWNEIGEDLEGDLPEIEVPDSDFVGDEVDDPLFDSRRDYVEQIDRYKAHQGKAVESFSGTCQKCGNEFTSVRSGVMYCSDKCRAAASRGERVETFATCKTCGNQFAAVRTTSAYCSPKCRGARPR